MLSLHVSGLLLFFVFIIHPRFAIIGSIGGALGWLVYLLASNFKSEISCYFLAMAFVALFSEISARIYKAPATIFLIIGCFPLVLDVESIKQCYTVRKVTVNYFSIHF
ncbi:MAG: threonine/serine exporter family protein [Thomasclavelia ramosa]